MLYYAAGQYSTLHLKRPPYPHQYNLLFQGSPDPVCTSLTGLLFLLSNRIDWWMKEFLILLCLNDGTLLSLLEGRSSYSPVRTCVGSVEILFASLSMFLIYAAWKVCSKGWPTILEQILNCLDNMALSWTNKPAYQVVMPYCITLWMVDV